MPGTARRTRAQRARRVEDAVNEEPPRELDFARGDERGGRAGDERRPEDIADEFPAARVRQAGLSGGEIAGSLGPDSRVTADDMAPETLLDEERSRTPDAHARRDAADTLLSDADEATIGEGTGADEAEFADEDPIDPDELAERRQDAGETGYDDETADSAAPPDAPRTRGDTDGSG